MSLPEGSVAAAIAQLARWLDRGGPRMARAEYLTEMARTSVMAWLATRVSVEDAVLPNTNAPDAVADWMIGTLRKAAHAPTRTIVCFRGFDAAFTGPLPEALAALNFGREAYKEAGAAQIWWFSSEFLGPFVRGAPDLDSWFDLKLSVTEVPPEARLQRHSEHTALAPVEARRRADSLFGRAEYAIRSGEPWQGVWKDLVTPALEYLRSAGLSGDAQGHAKRLSDLVMELRSGEVAQPRTPEDALALAEVFRDQGEWDTSMLLAKEALAGGEHLQAQAWRAIAWIQSSRGQLDEALASLRHHALPLAERAEDARDRALALGQIADIFEARGQLDEALRILQKEILPEFDKLGDIRSRAVTMGKIADIFQARGQLDEALRIRREEALPVYEKLGDIRSRAVTMGQIADIFQARGQLDEALRIRREEALPVYEKLGDIRERAVTMGKIADIFQARGQLDEALRIRREEELPVYDKLGDIRERAVTMGKIADVLARQGQIDEAIRIREFEVMPISVQLQSRSDLVFDQANLAVLLLRRDKSGDRDRAISLLREARQTAAELRLPEAEQIAAILQQIGAQ